VGQDLALAAYAAIPTKITSTGQKTDIALATVRIAFFHNDLVLARKKLEEAAACVPVSSVCVCVCVCMCV
jgi:hypothetical protein